MEQVFCARASLLEIEVTLDSWASEMMNAESDFVIQLGILLFNR